VIRAFRLEKHSEKKEKNMNAKKVGLALVIVALLSVSFAQNAFKPIGKPLPKPVPTSCPSDMLCW
jgi:hypothetical protein